MSPPEMSSSITRTTLHQQTWWRSFHREVFQARKTMPLLPSQPRDLKQWLGETDPSGITDLDQLCSNYDPAP